MKSAASGFITLLERDETNFCFVLTLTKRNGGIVRLSSAVGDVVYSGNTYSGTPGFDLTSVTSTIFGDAPTVDMIIPVRSGGLVDSTDIVNGFYEGAKVEILALDYLQPSQGAIKVFRGKVNQIDGTDSGTATFRCIGFSVGLSDLIVETFTLDCQTNLGDPVRCKVDLTSFTKSAVIATIIDKLNFTITVTEPLAVDGWFANGAVKFLTGANAGLAFDIRNWTRSTSHVSLWLRTNAAVQVGDTMSIIPGCDKTAATCFSKFKNIINFQGFPKLPTNAALSCDIKPLEKPPVGSFEIVDC